MMTPTATVAAALAAVPAAGVAHGAAGAMARPAPRRQGAPRSMRLCGGRLSRLVHPAEEGVRPDAFVARK
jgi:hypothetical protein